MPKDLLLKHYRGGPEPHRPVPPIDQWAPEDVEAHMAFQHHVSELLEENGEYVDAQALSPARTFVRYGGPGGGRAPPARPRPPPPTAPTPRPATGSPATGSSTSIRTSARSNSRRTSPPSPARVASRCT